MLLITYSSQQLLICCESRLGFTEHAVGIMCKHSCMCVCERERWGIILTPADLPELY